MPIRCPLHCIHHVNLRVRNLRDSVRFYCELFGLEEQPVQPASILSRQCVARRGSQGGGFGVVLTQGLPASMEVLGVDHIAFEVSTPEMVRDLHQRAQARHLRVTDPRVFDGYWQCFVFDPDGYKIEILAPPECASAALGTADEQAGES